MPASAERGITRRQVTGGLLALPVWLTLGSEITFLLETEKNSPVLILDVFDIEKYLRSDHMLHYWRQVAAYKKILSDPAPGEKKWVEIITNDPKLIELFVLSALGDRFSSHGEKVAAIRENTALFFDQEVYQPPVCASVLDSLQIQQIDVNEIGNPVVTLTINSLILQKIISQSPAGIVNMSFEPGVFEAEIQVYCQRYKYPVMRNQSPFKKKFVFRNDTGEREERVLCFDWRGNPISLQTYQVIKERAEARVIVPSDQVQIAYIDGYAGKNTLANLKELAQIAILNPAKLFVVAGGNPSIGLDYKIPDIRTARAVLEKAGSWPDNIIVVGAREGTRSANKLLSLGADIYVDGEDLRRFGFETCSSFSVPVITEIVYQLTKKGIQNPSEINYFLVLFSDLRRSDNNVYYRLLNLEKARQFLGTV